MFRTVPSLLPSTPLRLLSLFFFFNDTATTEIYTLSLHDALPISRDSISRARMTTDEFEIWFEKGVTDGLPVVPPTRSRVARMLAGTRRGPDELIGEMAPNYGRLTVEKAATNAVMAGCRPEHLPGAIAPAEGACDPAFNLHGMSASTHFAAPLIVVNGPIRSRIGLNRAFGVF